jgi:hypothetical protein
MFSSVARVFRRSFFAAPPRKSRHELVSEAHIAYMQAHERSMQAQQGQLRQAESLSPSASTSSFSSRSSSSSSSSSSVEDSVDASPEESPFESLCHELQRVEEFTHRRCLIAHETYYR